LEAFFSGLPANDLTINLEKSVVAFPTFELVGHTILAAGSAPKARHTAAIDSCPDPQEIKQLQRFLGMHELLPLFPSWLCPFFAAFD
jgi:hypothetical protein